jgi:LmbE family N-acetylglucosaminyl deacetylase
MSQEHYATIYLSPHLDDVVLSCGGTVHRRALRGQRSLVITLFAGSPDEDANTAFSQELKERWGGAQDPVGVRREEDLAALRAIGADAAHLPFLDCVYRRGPHSGADLYPTVAHIFGDVDKEEALLHLELLEALRPTLQAHPAATICAPLAVGHHVDHIIALRAAFVLAAEGRTVRCYEDYPYAVQPAEVQRALDALGPCALGWERSCECFGAESLRAKTEAVAAYRSQISTFWPDLDAMRRDVAAYAESVGQGRYGESFWSAAAR